MVTEPAEAIPDLERGCKQRILEAHFLIEVAIEQTFAKAEGRHDDSPWAELLMHCLEQSYCRRQCRKARR